jgi:hypothetical protein
MRNFIWAVPAILIGIHSAAIADTVLPGTEVALRTDQPIEFHTWDRGRIYPARSARCSSKRWRCWRSRAARPLS